jgi:hypothetical protein
VADKRITDLTPIAAGDLDAQNDVLAVADVSAAETKKLKVVDAIASSAGSLPPESINGDVIINGTIGSLKLEEDCITTRELAPSACYTENYLDKSVTEPKLADGSVGTNQLIDGSVTGDKLSPDAISDAAIADRSLDGIKLKLNTLTQDELGPDCVGVSELADNSVDTPAIIDGVLTTPKYQNASVTDEKLANGIDGGKLTDGSVDTNQLADGSVTSDKLAGDITLDKLPDAPPNTVLAGSNGGVTGPASFRQLAPNDLPAATAAQKGGVSIPGSSGLSVDGAGAIRITNTVTPNGFPFVNFDEHGLITSGRALSNSDLPPPALGEIGGVKAGDGINIAADGTISQSLTGIVPGTYTKLTVDDMGNATAGGALEASDIPAIGFDQINGEIAEFQLANKSVTRPKLADYAISFIQEIQPTVDASVHTGCMWFQESTASLYMWNGNSWMSIGIGRLSAENLRYCGTINASTGLITGLTQFGTGESFVIGDPLPAPSDELTGVYFVVDVGGDQINQPNVSNENFGAGNWCVCNGQVDGWHRVLATNSGGGGGAALLGELNDVSIPAALEGALLQLQGDGQWKDVYALDAGVF